MVCRMGTSEQAQQNTIAALWAWARGHFDPVKVVVSTLPVTCGVLLAVVNFALNVSVNSQEPIVTFDEYDIAENGSQNPFSITRPDQESDDKQAEEKSVKTWTILNPRLTDTPSMKVEIHPKLKCSRKVLDKLVQAVCPDAHCSPKPEIVGAEFGDVVIRTEVASLASLETTRISVVLPVSTEIGSAKLVIDHRSITITHGHGGSSRFAASAYLYAFYFAYIIPIIVIGLGYWIVYLRCLNVGLDTEVQLCRVKLQSADERHVEFGKLQNECETLRPENDLLRSENHKLRIIASTKDPRILGATSPSEFRATLDSALSRVTTKLNAPPKNGTES